MKVKEISSMSWEEQHAHGVKRMVYFYTQLVKDMKWDFTSSRSPEMEFLPRYSMFVADSYQNQIFHSVVH